MKRFLQSLLAAATATALVSCGAISRSVDAIQYNNKLKKNKRGQLADGQHRLDQNSGLPRGGTPRVTGGSISPMVIGELPKEEDIIWAPMDPNQPIVGLEQIAVASEEPVDDWVQSYEKAMRMARSQGKPVLMWFTSTGASPLSERLSEELFSQGDFNSWAKKNVVRLRVDSNQKRYKQGERGRKMEYINKLKKRFKVLGSPVVLVLSSEGKVFGKYRGYKPGSSVYYFRRLKSAHLLAQKEHMLWRKEMEQKGYRDWHSNTGKAVFAKITSYSKKSIGLVEPDGRKSRVPMRQLSMEDQRWIEEQKAKATARR